MDLTHLLAFLGTLLGSFLAQAAHDRAKEGSTKEAIVIKKEILHQGLE